MVATTVQVTLTDKTNCHIIKNMYPLYLHDLSGHYGLVADHTPNQHGIFENSDRFKTLHDQYDEQNIWWEKPGVLFPFLIQADHTPAGFALIATSPYCSQEVDYFMSDFFVLQPFRGTGVAQIAATYLFEQFNGKWAVYTNPSPKNMIGQQFWEKTIAQYTKGSFVKQNALTHDGDKLIFSFCNHPSTLNHS
jgi:predicted acetyltransferase